VATLCNSAVGAGVLSLPFAFRCSGLVGGLLLCLLVAFAESFSLYVLSKFAERYSAPSYGSLVRRALGRKTASSLSAIMLLYLAGSCIAYLVGRVQRGELALWVQQLNAAPRHPVASEHAPAVVPALVVIIRVAVCRTAPQPSPTSPQVIIGDTFSSLAQQAFGISAYTDRQPILLGVAVLAILPMCFARSLSALGATSFQLRCGLRAVDPA
jgi:amino acid permease